MRKIVFWMGAILLVVGIFLAFYGYTIIQNLYTLYGSYLFEILYYNEGIKRQWDIGQLLEPLGLGVLVLGAIMLAYGTLKK